MKFEDSKYASLLNYSKVQFSFGTFYLFDKFIISELHEGIHFSWDKIQEVIAYLFDHYGDDFKIGYISNRINPYSIEPQLWVKFNKEYNFIIASAMVYYTDLGYINTTIEKLFSKKSIKRCNSLDQAIEWLLNLKEFKPFLLL